MKDNSLTHYRDVFKSDHLGVVDLEGFIESGNKELIFTVKQVKQERGAKVAGKEINANIAYFVEDIKPLVLNATSSKTMKNLTGSCFVENWKNIKIQLYINRDAKLMGEVVGGVAVSPRRIHSQKSEITKNHANLWKNAKAAFVRDGNFDKVLEKAILSKENQALMIKEINDGI